MFQRNTRLTARHIVRWSIVAGFAALTACGPRHTSEPPPELRWARSALERNPHVKVLSVDEQANSIKIQVKASGQEISVTPGELAAIPIADLVALNAKAQMSQVAATPVVSAPADASTSIEPPPAPASAPEPEAPATPTYVVQREDGRVRITGPGVSIESLPQTDADAAKAAPRYDEPIICEGRRMLHLDNRNLRIDGDAIVIRGGCELHLTNSNVAATGVGVMVVDGAVHIANSVVQGDAASLQLGTKAKAFLRGTNFKGISRRDENATIQDLGGNVWQ